MASQDRQRCCHAKNKPSNQKFYENHLHTNLSKISNLTIWTLRRAVAIYVQAMEITLPQGWETILVDFRGGGGIYFSSNYV